jgi:hypothetical protein
MGEKYNTIRISLISVLCLLFCLDGDIKAQITVGDIPLPSEEYERIQEKYNSFGQWLSHLPLKVKGSPVLNYRGGYFKSGGDSTVYAVIDKDIKNRRLEQCMDILVRFYAEYLWSTGDMKKFSLPLPGGYWLDWSDWKNGDRPQFTGIKMDLKSGHLPDSSFTTFQKYLNMIYSVSHTQQFYHTYQLIDKKNIQPGDFIVSKGTKGHAVMVVDLAKKRNGELVALIGNGDTPACNFFLLSHKSDQPWIPLRFDQEILDLPLKRKITWDGLRRFALPMKEQSENE